jgi:arabinose-5-phosphate isomerase
MAVKGRLVVTGMGKSGHVGHKIAATLASTGTPAFFVHPAEASHGDMGMITPADLVIAISNSGETNELADLIYYTRRYQIPLVAITSGADSNLATAADYALILPSCPEACPMGMAPTTSTTMTLALGDALAVSLMHWRGFSPQDYKMLHPGGQLGRQLLRVSDVMHKVENLPLVPPTQLMGDVLVVMTSRGFGCAGVVDENNRLLGIITDGDLRRHMAPNLLTCAAADIMTSSPLVISATTMLAEALGILNQKAILALFVVDEMNRVQGLVHIHDCLRLGIK